LLGLLVLATAWLGYITLNSSTPDSLAFNVESVTSTTAPPAPTTTTEAPIRQWSAGEVDGRYRDAFVHVELSSCSAPGPDGAPATVTNMALSVGINIDQATTVIDTTPLPGARLAQIVSQTGSSRIAILDPQPSGVTVGHSPTLTRNDLQLASDPAGDTTFFTSFESEQNRVSTSTSPIDELAVIAVTNQGDVSYVEIGGRRLEVHDLGELTLQQSDDSDASDSEEETPTDAVRVNTEIETAADNICSWVNALELPGQSPVTNEQLTSDGDTADTETAEDIQ